MAVLHFLTEAPAPHPHDKPLLKPLSMLGKPATMFSGVSFLRRTEYISSGQGGTPFQSTTSQDLVKPRSNPNKRKRADAELKKDAKYILTQVVKGFEIANSVDADASKGRTDSGERVEVTAEERSAWTNPAHPSRPDLKLLDSYPVLPDLGAVTDTGSWYIAKFISNPAIDADQYDHRVDLGLLRPTPAHSAAAEQRAGAIAAYEADPSLPNPGPPLHDFDFFLPAHEEVDAIRAGFDVNIDHAQDSSVERDEGGKQQKVLRYSRLRTYETYQQSLHEDKYGDIVAVALHDAAAGEFERARLQKAAYYYPIAQRTFIRPRRRMTDRPGFSGPTTEDEEQKVDCVDVVIREPDELEVSARDEHRTEMLPLSMRPLEADTQGDPDD